MPKIQPKHKLICVRCGNPFDAVRANARYCLHCRLHAPKPLNKQSRPTKLRNCPYCGNAPKLRNYQVSSLDRCRYECSNNNCIASMLPARDFLTEHDAANAWNGRV